MGDLWRIVSEVDLYGSAEAAERALALFFVSREQVYGPRNPNIEDTDLDLDALDHQNDFVDAPCGPRPEGTLACQGDDYLQRRARRVVQPKSTPMRAAKLL